jgi:hypothetical protein
MLDVLARPRLRAGAALGTGVEKSLDAARKSACAKSLQVISFGDDRASPGFD